MRKASDRTGEAASTSTTVTPTTTASIKLLQRASPLHGADARAASLLLHHHSSTSSQPQPTAVPIPASAAARLVRVHRRRYPQSPRADRQRSSRKASLEVPTTMRATAEVSTRSLARLDRPEQGQPVLAKRAEPEGAQASSTIRRTPGTTTAATTMTKISSSSSRVTTTNLPLGSGSSIAADGRRPDREEAAAAEPSACAYVGGTSIPKGAGGALFSTLERIFAGKFGAPSRGHNPIP